MTKNRTSTKVVLLACLALSILILVPNIPRSYAHAFVVGSDPVPFASLNTPPSQVEVDFIDPIDIKHSQIKVLDANGKDVAENDFHYISSDDKKTAVSLPPNLPNGIYTVDTKVLDETDGHTTENAFVFALGQPIPQNLLNKKESVSFADIVSVYDAIARYPSLLGQIMVVGALFSTFWLWKPLSRVPVLMEGFAQIRVKIDRNMTKIVLLGTIIILVGNAAMILSEMHSINSGFTDAVATKFGNMWLVRTSLSSALFGLAFFAFLRQKKSDKLLPKGLVAGLFGLGITVLTTTTLIGHGAASGIFLALILDFVHNVVASLWIGGVIYLAFAVAPLLKQVLDKSQSASVLAIIIPRFSTIVVGLLGLVAITGPSLLYELENNLSLTLASIYGETLIIKLSLAAAMIVFGAYHQFILYKQVRRTISAEPMQKYSGALPIEIKVPFKNGNGGMPVAKHFNRFIKIEAILGLFLIASIAVLVDSGLPPTQFQNELSQQKSQIPHIYAFATPLVSQNQFAETRFTDSGDKIVMSINPYYSGKNNITLYFFGPDDKPLTGINATSITLEQVDRGIGPLVVGYNPDNPQAGNAFKELSTGVFSISTSALAIPGHWNAQVEGITTKAGALNAVTTFDDLYLKPNLSQMQANITEYKMPDKAQPLYPLYDPIRDVVWVGDSAIGSGRLLEFDLATKQFTPYKVEDNQNSSIASTVMDFQNNIWFVDPLTKVLGNLDPESGKTQSYHIPISGPVSGLAIDRSGNLWMTAPVANQLLEFEMIAKKFHTFPLPQNSTPLGISIDQSTNQIWVAASSSGKIVKVDPAQNYAATEYGPQNGTLNSPTGILYDPVANRVFVSEHDGQAISVFDPLTDSFQRYALDPNQNDLPLGMVFDANHDLWIAQHTFDKIAVVDPRTGNYEEFGIPTNGTWTQWLAVDSHGEIILAEYHSAALGILTTGTKPGFAENTGQMAVLGVPLGFSFADVAGPSIACCLIAVAFIYTKSTTEVRDSLRQIKKAGNFSH